ncbi:MAG: putative domain HDIG-containing protein [Proteobacteria bacterium]|nr:putative domain HDIG-containing protein [Pseudomonadota bacterium]
MSIHADLRHVIYALSEALDLVGVDDVGHGKRVGIMAAECARAKGLDEEKVTFLFDLGMLHDIGVSSTGVHAHLVKEFDWLGSQDHCETGYARLSGFAPLAHMALPVKYHHTRWDQLQTLQVSPEVAWQANLILLVDRVDALTAPYYADNSVLLHREDIREQVRLRAGTYFAPELVELFLNVSQREAFWLLLEPRSIQRVLQDRLAQGLAYQATMGELRPLAEIFARIVDAKSAFTVEHSLGVAGVARFLAERMGVGAENCDKIEIAGLLHDLGKLRVPDEILDKPGKLDPDERLVINTHSFETYQILRHIQGFEELANWAAWHHEEPDGSGYPFHLKSVDMPLEARILRVADIFQAMAQDRPYRPGLDAAALRGFFAEMVAANRVDAQIVALLMTELDAALQVARSPQRRLAA